ncbi:MAG: flagellar protein FlgN, partial [Chloroflexota bacterium]
VYEQLLQVTEQERRAIVDARLPALKAAVEQKQEILSTLAELEEQRVRWVNRYARRNDVPVETLTLLAIIQGSRGAERRLLSRLHRGLTQRIERVMQRDQVTRALLQSILKSIDTSLHYLLRDDAAGNTYAARGGLQQTFVASWQLLDRRA